VVSVAAKEDMAVVAVRADMAAVAREDSVVVAEEEEGEGEGEGEGNREARPDHLITTNLG
jgi:hypothetical protein